MIFWLFALLGTFLAVAALINRLAGRFVLNGAALFLWLAGGGLLLITMVAAVRGADLYSLGLLIGSAVLPLLLAAWLARRFRPALRKQARSP